MLTMDNECGAALPQYFTDLQYCVKLFDAGLFVGKNVLITGASGLVGRTLVEFFSLFIGCNVFALVRNANILPPFNGKCTLVTGGIRMLQNIHIKFDYIVHCASPSDPLSFCRSPTDVLHINIEYVRILLELLRKQGCGRLCNVSSGEIYGVVESQDIIFMESDICTVDVANVRNCYPIAKMASEAQCVAYGVQYGVDYIIVRPCHIFGPNFKSTDSHAVCEFLKNAHNKRRIELNSLGLKTRNYIYVVDVAIAITQLLLVSNASEIYNVASDDVLSIKDIAMIIADLCDIDVIINSKDDNMYSRQRNVLSNIKILQTGWRQQFTLRQALKNTLGSLGYFQGTRGLMLMHGNVTS